MQGGNYAITGTVSAVTGSSCPAALKQTVTGALPYPGTNPKDSVLITLQSAVAGKSVTAVFMSAFPPVPSAGLNGWTKASPVSPNYSQYQDGRLVGGGTSAVLTFNLGAVGFGSLAAVQGKMTMDVGSIGPCNETFLLTFQRVAPFTAP
jgi:hypothetical protein